MMPGSLQVLSSILDALSSSKAFPAPRLPAFLFSRYLEAKRRRALEALGLCFTLFLNVLCREYLRNS